MGCRLVPCYCVCVLSVTEEVKVILFNSGVRTLSHVCPSGMYITDDTV